MSFQAGSEDRDVGSMSQTFLDSLARSQLLSAAETDDVRRKAAALGLDSLGLANYLGEQGLLTPWQALQLLAGHTSFYLGPYRLLERIGSGGAAIIYKARHVKLGYIAALKVVSAPATQHPIVRARFRREVRAAVAVRHPNIVATYAGRCTGASSYLVMEYVDGDDLDHWLKRYEELPLEWCCEVARQVALGLDHIHRQGIVHRDIKPNNLLIVARSLREVPHVKIADLGAASIKAGMDGGETPLTSINQFLGTPNYVAPEQVLNARDVDHRADLFSLGCTLFRLLTRQTPWGGASLSEKLLARTRQDAPPVSQYRNGVAPELDAAVARMLARDPGDRIASAREIAALLRPFALDAEKSNRAASLARPSVGAGATPKQTAPANSTPASAPAVSAPAASVVAAPAASGSASTVVERLQLPDALAAGPPKPLPWKWFLERQNANGLKETYVLNPVERLVVGRAADCDIQVRDLQVSRRHCLLSYREGKWQLHDLCSNNGTLVNGVAIQQAELKHGDQLRFGATVLTLAAAPQFAAASDTEASCTTGLDGEPPALQDAETIHSAGDNETAGIQRRLPDRQPGSFIAP